MGKLAEMGLGNRPREIVTTWGKIPMYLGAKLSGFSQVNFWKTLVIFFLIFQGDADADADEFISFFRIVKIFFISSKLIQNFFPFLNECLVSRHRHRHADDRDEENTFFFFQKQI